MAQPIPVSNQTLMIFTQDDKALREFYEQRRFLRDRNEFYRENKVKIETLHGNMKRIQDKYCELKDGRIVTEGEGKDIQVKMLEGMNREDFDKEWKELMEKENSIKV